MGEGPLALNHIDPCCQIGPGTVVWQFASVIRGAVIGSDCSIGAGAIVDGATLGDRCRVGHAASIHPGARIGNDVMIGPGAIICNDRWPSTEKDGFDEGALSQFASVIIEDGATVGAGAIILPGVRIGAGALIAAGAVVRGIVPAGFVGDGQTVRPKPDDWRQRRMRLLA